MKHTTLLLAALAALPVAASAQVQLVAGWNFGQFLPDPAGTPILDGGSFEAVGYVPSNWTSSANAGPEDTGAYKQDNGLSTIYSAGTGVIRFDGSNSSSVWGANASIVIGSGLDATNAQTVTGNPMYSGDDSFISLRFTAGAGITDFSLTVDTSGFVDFAPGDYAQDNDFNFTFSAYNASGSSASIEWLLDGTPIATTTANGGAGNFQALVVDLPAAFYGQANATLVGRVTGDIVIDHAQINGVAASPIPEPSSFAAIAALAGLATASLRRRRATA